ncbi:E3 ubiquitin-protein ligase rnf8 [Parasteatoda tepidariorum]|nr:E3 ubiquitin-protein ligase rnf8 [Parasteatoda tepidariorum]
MARRNVSQNKITTGSLEKIVGVNSGKKTPLYDYDVILGRSKTAYISSQDPNVSRNHCSLKYTPNGWLIKDLGSVNGTYIDNVRIPSNEHVPLTSGCSIYFGPKEDAPEGYKFEGAKLSNGENELGKRASRKNYCSQKSSDTKAVKRKASPTGMPPQNSSEKRTVIDVIGVPAVGNSNLLVKSNNHSCEEDGYHTDSSISSLDSLKTRIRKANSSQKKKEKRARFCREDNLIGPSTSTGLFRPVPGLERLPFQENSDSENSQSLLNDDIADWNPDSQTYKNQDLKNVSPVKKFLCSTDLNSSSVAVHSNLLKVLQKKVNDLQKTIKTLNLKFSDTMNENARLVEVLKSKEEAEINVKEDFKKLLEDELICNICTELYIKPITLGCSHTFCQHCIFEWKKKKKQCPMCRERIETETTCLFLDNFINKAVEKLDPPSLEKRLELLKKREESQKKKPKRKKSKSNNRRTSNPPEVAEVDREDEVEYLRSRISEIQSYTDDIQSYVDVIDELINDRIPDSGENNSHAYFGGFGRCYNCGRLGHWADDCPH